MDATAIRCPNCGAALGPLQDGQYLCAYCGQSSGPPEPALDQARQDELVARAVAKHDAVRFARERDASEELAARGRAAAAAGMQAGARAIVAVLVMVCVFAVVSFGAAICVAADVVPKFLAQALGLNAQNQPRIFVTLVIVGIAVVAFGGKIYADVRPTFGPRLFGTRRERRLLADGLRGRAIVMSYRQRDLFSNNPKFDLVLRVELSGRPACVVKRVERVPCPEAVTTGGELPVFVGAGRADDVLVDWATAGRM